MKCVKVSDFQSFLFQKVVECHGEKRRGGQVLLDRLRLLGSQDSPGVLKIIINYLQYEDNDDDRCEIRSGRLRGPSPSCPREITLRVSLSELRYIDR